METEFISLPIEIIDKILTAYNVEPLEIFYTIQKKREVLKLTSPFMLNRELTESYLKKNFYKHLKLVNVTSEKLYKMPLFGSRRLFDYNLWIQEVSLTSRQDMSIYLAIPFHKLSNCKKLTVMQASSRNSVSTNSFLQLVDKVARESRSITHLVLKPGHKYNSYLLTVLSKWSKRDIYALMSLDLTLPIKPDLTKMCGPVFCDTTLTLGPFDVSRNFHQNLLKAFPRLISFTSHSKVDNYHDFSIFPYLTKLQYHCIENCPPKMEFVKCHQLKLKNLKEVAINHLEWYWKELPPKDELTAVLSHMRATCEKYKITLSESLGLSFSKGLSAPTYESGYKSLEIDDEKLAVCFDTEELEDELYMEQVFVLARVFGTAFESFVNDEYKNAQSMEEDSYDHDPYYGEYDYQDDYFGPGVYYDPFEGDM